MAASSEYDIDFEELERLFIDDTTDEQFSFDENEAISEPSLSGKDSFLSTNVSVSSLKLVLDGLADRQTNFVEQERAIASVLSKVEEVKFVEFVASAAGLFEQCFGLRSSKPNKHLRAIELERNFTECRSKTNPASKAWEDTLLYCTLVSQKVLLLTMCTCIYSSISGLLMDLFSSEKTHRDQLLKKLLIILWRLMRSRITRAGQ